MKKIIAVGLALMMILFLGSCHEEKSKKEYEIEYVDNLTVEVGQNIDPRDYFTLKDGETAIEKEAINLAIVSGSLSTVGTIQYKISYDGQEFELVLTIVEKKNPDPSKDPIDKPDDPKVDPLLVALENSLKKNYDNVTLTVEQNFSGDINDSTGQEINADFSLEEVKYLNPDKYHIVYEDSEETSLDFFVVENDTYVNLYTKSVDTWKNTQLSQAQWQALDYSNELVYADYYSNYISPQSFSLQVSEFKVEDGKIVCIPSRLDLVGQKIFNVNDDNAVFTSLTITVENDVLKQIIATYESTDEYGPFTCEIKYTYSNVGSTQIDVPDVAAEIVEAPEHIDPASAQPLTDLQKQTLTQALKTEYTNYEFEYFYNEDDGYSVIYEHDFVNEYTYRIHQSVSEYGGLQHDTYDYYFEIQDVTANRKYYIYEVDENKQYVRTSLETQQDIINYMPLAVSPSKLGLDVASFGMVGNQYVCMPSGLSKEVSNFTSLSGASLVSLVITLDKNEKVQTIELITKVEAATGTYFIEESYEYMNIDSIKVDIPTPNTSVLKDMTTIQTEALETAFNKNYSNVTLYDEYMGSTFYFAGSQVMTWVYVDYEIVTDYYKIEDGKYYEFKDGSYTEIPFHSDNKEEVSFDYYLPVPSFKNVDISKVYYNEFSDSYYISMSDLNIKSFMFYFDVEEQLGITFTGVEFILDEEGRIQKINLEGIDTENNYYVGYGIKYYDYGTTKVE
ncbi:MAG: hypothetical protein NC310_00075 [Roseburia sp.]|nr:hypothetical protein [Anaeroplasma bactoclasticum]MCM1195450.1 hypothetical protein [Roseburia sp.]MCM1555929.1 hypothetical protein [Anaeroplasma bactoclasticum]